MIHTYPKIDVPDGVLDKVACHIGAGFGRVPPPSEMDNGDVPGWVIEASMKAREERGLEVFSSHVAAQKFVERAWLVEHRHRQDDEVVYYLPCPICGRSDHCLTERRPAALVAHCHVSGKFLLIREIDVVAVMEKEERDFVGQVKEWEGKLPDKMTVEEAFTSRTQDGVPAELLEGRVDDPNAFYRRLEEHRDTGRAGKKFRSEIF